MGGISPAPSASPVTWRPGAVGGTHVGTFAGNQTLFAPLAGEATDAAQGNVQTPYMDTPPGAIRLRSASLNVTANDLDTDSTVEIVIGSGTAKATLTIPAGQTGAFEFDILDSALAGTATQLAYKLALGGTALQNISIAGATAEVYYT